MMYPHEVDDGAEHNQQEQVEQTRLREAMRDPNESAAVLEGDRSNASDDLEHVGQPEKLAPYGTSQLNEGETSNYDCAVVAQQNALTALGVESTTEEIRQIGEHMNPPAYGRGENASNQLKGTTPEGLGYAFDAKGVGKTIYTYTEQDGDIMDSTGPTHHLRDELSDGRAVLVAVDTQTLYNTPEPGGHALWVTGADFTPDGQLDRVHVNDPGIENGQNVTYDGNTFVNAWREYNYRTVSSETTFPFWDKEK